MFNKQSCNEKSNKNLFLPYVIRDVNCVCKQPPDDKSMLWCHWKIWGLQEKHVLVFVTSSLTFDTRMIPVWTTFTRSRLLHDAWRLDTYLGSYETFSQNHDISDNHWMKSSLNHYSNKGYTIFLVYCDTSLLSNIFGLGISIWAQEILFELAKTFIW